MFNRDVCYLDSRFAFSFCDSHDQVIMTLETDAKNQRILSFIEMKQSKLY